MAIHQSRAITTHSYNVGCSNLGVAFTSHFSNLLFAPNCTCRHARSYRTRLHPVRSTGERWRGGGRRRTKRRRSSTSRRCTCAGRLRPGGVQQGRILQPLQGRPQGAGPKGNYWGSPYPVYTLPGKEAQFQVPGCYHFIVKPSKDCTSYEMKKHEVTKDCPRYKDLPWEITVEPALVPPLHGPGIKIRKKAPASAKVPEPKPKGRSSSSGGKDETTSITTDQA